MHYCFYSFYIITEVQQQEPITEDERKKQEEKSAKINSIIGKNSLFSLIIGHAFHFITKIVVFKYIYIFTSKLCK